MTNDSAAAVNLTNPTLVNGESVVSGELGKFHVTDLRQVTKPGWNLSTTVLDFTKGTDTIANSALGIDPKDAAPDHWSHVHNRISVGEVPRPYSREHHHAWLLRRKVEG